MISLPECSLYWYQLIVLRSKSQWMYTKVITAAISNKRENLAGRDQEHCGLLDGVRLHCDKAEPGNSATLLFSASVLRQSGCSKAGRAKLNYSVSVVSQRHERGWSWSDFL